MGETTQGRAGKWAKRPGGETTRGERESGRNDSGANGKVGETTRILNDNATQGTQLNTVFVKFLQENRFVTRQTEHSFIHPN